MIDSTNIDSAIFGTGKFYKEKQDDKKEDIYSNIDEMLNSTLELRIKKIRKYDQSFNKKVTFKSLIKRI